MGHSITEFQGQAFGTSDFKLDVWLKLLSREMGPENSASGWLIEARDYWAHVGDWSGVGCIDAKLDHYLSDQERVDVVVALAESALKCLEDQGTELICDFLNELRSTAEGSLFTTDLDSIMFSIVGEDFLSLLRHQFATDSETTPLPWF